MREGKHGTASRPGFRGFRGSGGGFAADLKKGARLAPQVV